MRLIHQVLTLLTCVALLSGGVIAGNVFLLPNAPGTNVSAYDTTLNLVGSFPAGTVPVAVLTIPSGSKYYIISKTASAAINIVEGGFAAPTVRQLSLPAVPVAAAVTPDGTKLLALSSGLRVYETTSELVLFSNIDVGSGPLDMAVSQDSKTAYVLGSSSGAYIVSVVNLTTGEVSGTIPVPGLASAVSISPTNILYISSSYSIREVDTRTPAKEPVVISVNARPGKLTFSQDMKYAVFSNLFLNSTSVQILDLRTRAVAATEVINGPSGLVYPDTITSVSDGRMLAICAATQKMYEIKFLPLKIAEMTYFGSSTVGPVQSVAFSDEIPTKMMYISASGSLFSGDVPTSNVSLPVGAPQGALAWADKSSTGAAGNIQGFNGDQVAAGGKPLALPFVVRVTDNSGSPIYNAPVRFSAAATGAVLSASTATTNMNGIASVLVTAVPADAGVYAVTATSSEKTVSFNYTVSGTTGGGGGGGGTGSVTKITGDGQVLMLPVPANYPAEVLVLDPAGKPVEGATVTWNAEGGISLATSGGATSGQTPTDKDGKASVRFTWAATSSPGTGYLQASITASTQYGTQVFSVVGIPFLHAVPGTRLLSPPLDNQRITAKSGVKLPAAVVTSMVTSGGAGISGGKPVPGYSLTFNLPEGSPIKVTCDGGTPISGADGKATCDLIATGVGEISLDVFAGYFIKFPIRLTVTPGDPAAPKILSGNNQSGKPGDTLADAAVIELRDSGGAVLTGQSVAWEVVTPGTLSLVDPVTVTDTNGRASTKVKLGSTTGTAQLRAKVGAQSVLFTFTITVPVGGVVKVSGDAQAQAEVNQAFGQPLVVQVNNTAGAPVQGVAVNWAITGPGSLSTAATTSGADGRAQVTVTAGASAGPIVVTATVSGLPAITFNLSSRLAGPVLTSANFANFATGENGITPGSLARIAGPGLAAGIVGVRNATLLAGALPTTFEGVTVRFGSGPAAPIYQVGNMDGSQWVIIQVPYEVSGPTTNATVTVSGGEGSVTGITVRPYSPGVLEGADATGRRYAVVIGENGRYITAADPAKRGETVRLYAIGLGQTAPVAAGTNRAGAAGMTVQSPIAVGVDNKGVEVISATMSMNLIGVFEVVFRIPADAISGPDRPLGLVIEPVSGQQYYAQGSVIAIE